MLFAHPMSESFATASQLETARIQAEHMSVSCNPTHFHHPGPMPIRNTIVCYHDKKVNNITSSGEYILSSFSFSSEFSLNTNKMATKVYTCYYI